MEFVKTEIDHLNQTTLGELTALSAAPCISIYMPTHRRGSEIEQDPIRLKNLLSEIEKELLATGERRPAVLALLEPLYGLLDDREFWRYQGEGMAVFRTAEQLQIFRLPLHFAELTVISTRPHIKPLLPLIINNGHFYLLTLSQNEVRLFEGTRQRIGELSLGDTPTSLAEAMRFDEFEDQLQFHTQTGTRANGGRDAMFHGHSNAGDEAVIKENIKRFLNRVDAGVRHAIEEDRAPLVLAGVEMMQGLYNEVTKYPAVLGAGITGNVEMVSEAELHAQAWPLVEPKFAQAQQTAIDSYLHLAGTADERAATDLKAIVAGAYFQKVDTLFVAVGVQVWGSFDQSTNQVHVHEEQQTGETDLLDFAAIHTILNGGTVYALDPADIPGSLHVAAIFRY